MSINFDHAAFGADLETAVRAALGVKKAKDGVEKAKTSFRDSVATLVETYGLTAADIHSGHGKGNEKGPHYDALFDTAARVMLTPKQYALATDDSPTSKRVEGKKVYLPKHTLLNNVGNVVLDVRKALEPKVESEATEWEKEHSKLATQLNGLKKALDAATDKAAERQAKLGGAKQVKQAIAAFDTLIACLPKK